MFVLKFGDWYLSPVLGCSTPMWTDDPDEAYIYDWDESLNKWLASIGYAVYSKNIVDRQEEIDKWQQHNSSLAPKSESKPG